MMVELSIEHLLAMEERKQDGESGQNWRDMKLELKLKIGWPSG